MGIAAWVTQANIDRIDAGLDPSAEQLASIDVDPKVEIAAARKHAAAGRAKKPAKAKTPKKAKPAKATNPKHAKATKAKKARKMSALDAAAQVHFLENGLCPVAVRPFDANGGPQDRRHNYSRMRGAVVLQRLLLHGARDGFGLLCAPEIREHPGEIGLGVQRF